MLLRRSSALYGVAFRGHAAYRAARRAEQGMVSVGLDNGYTTKYVHVINGGADHLPRRLLENDRPAGRRTLRPRSYDDRSVDTLTRLHNFREASTAALSRRW